MGPESSLLSSEYLVPKLYSEPDKSSLHSHTSSFLSVERNCGVAGDPAHCYSHCALVHDYIRIFSIVVPSLLTQLLLRPSWKFTFCSPCVWISRPIIYDPTVLFIFSQVTFPFLGYILHFPCKYCSWLQSSVISLDIVISHNNFQCRNCIDFVLK
jgi:hypothetical protein